jgi:hypothetical protein
MEKCTFVTFLRKIKIKHITGSTGNNKETTMNFGMVSKYFMKI